jgi:hypothetical protein
MGEGQSHGAAQHTHGIPHLVVSLGQLHQQDEQRDHHQNVHVSPRPWALAGFGPRAAPVQAGPSSQAKA